MARHSVMFTRRALAFALAAVFGTGIALADKPSGAGEKGGKGNSAQAEHREAARGPDTDRAGKGPDTDRASKGPDTDRASKGPGMDRASKGPGTDRGSKGRDAEHAGKGPGAGAARVEHFGDPHRTYVRDYYDGQFRAGKKCPPGLAKKNNGCMPPGQAKKWDVGQVLPRDVRYYEVPAPLVIQLGQPPAGYRYVRVNDDILLLATGTRMIVDAIRNLGR